jgi:hypothetical protein
MAMSSKTSADAEMFHAESLRFVSERALDACSTYGEESVSLVAVKP